jgi:hypothetical protein
MTAKTDTAVARLEAILERLERLGLAPPTPGQQAAVNPDGTPAPVVSGELIESAWGNAVSDSITELRRFHGVLGASSGQTIANATEAPISWTEQWDSNAYFGGGSTITIPTGLSGTYGIQLRITSTTLPAGVVRVRIETPGELATGYMPSGYGDVSVSNIVPILDGGTVKALVYNNSGASLIFTGILRVFRLHPAVSFS